MRFPVKHPLLLAAMLLASGCSPVSSPRMPADPASIAGRVTAVTRSGERIGSIRVEERPSDVSGSAKASVRVVQGTNVLRDGNRVDFDALQVGQWVRVWFTGPVAESYPVQATGGTVSIDSTTSR